MNDRAERIADQHGRVAVVTGATGGIGYETAMALAGAGAHVVLAGRDAARADGALQAIRAACPRASVEAVRVDLASLAQVERFAAALMARHARIDVLVNNAGVMTPPTRQASADGFELQFGTNYLAHFALTAWLAPALERAEAARVVNVSSVAHRMRAAIHFDDPQWTRAYAPWPAYAQSKLAMLMFSFELQRRCDRHGRGWRVVAAHPGYARTGLFSAGRGLGEARRSPLAGLAELGQRALQPWLSQSAADGAQPVIYAATSPDARAGGYYGPQGRFELRGVVGPARIGAAARDTAVAARLWTLSEQLSGVAWLD